MTAPGPSPAGGFRDVRMRGFQDRSEVAEVLSLLALRIHLLPSETISLHEAGGRVLATDVVAPVAVPAFDRAAMDGYALIGSESFGADPYNPLEFTIVGDALPGQPFAGQMASGQAVRIMTGAAHAPGSRRGPSSRGRRGKRRKSAD